MVCASTTMAQECMTKYLAVGQVWTQWLRNIIITADTAAIDFGYFYNDNSIRENREYASNIFRVRNAQGKIGYTYDVAISGGTKNITIK